jgi:ribosomal protein S24E
MNIVQDFNNKLLARREVIAEYDSQEATVSRAKAKEKLAKEMKTEPKLVLIQNISTHYGDTTARVKAHLYADEATMEKVASKHIIERNKKALPQEAAGDAEGAEE